MLGCVSVYMILNLMSETGIDGYRTASVLGYCLLPMVLLSSISVLLSLGYTRLSRFARLSSRLSPKHITT